jgi:hypothetical protein
VNDHRSWWVGEFSAKGAVVRSFGTHGWTSMLPPGGSSDFYPWLQDVSQSNTGMIYVAGNNAQSHAGTVGYIAALLPNGRLDRAFGTAGFTAVLPQMTYVGPMFLQPNGTIAVTGWLGGGGCGVTEIAWVSTDGAPARWMDRNYDAAHGYPLKWCFGGVAFADAEGGVGLAGSNFSLQGPQPSLPTRIEALTDAGTVDPAFGDAGNASYRIPVVDGVAITHGGDVVLLGIQTGRVTLVDFSWNGLPVRGFGRNDFVDLAYNSRFNGNVLVLPGPQNDVTVVIQSPNAITVHEFAA